MKLDTDVSGPAAGTPDAALEQHASPGALIHGVLAAASSVADSASRVLAAHRLTVDEHALLSRLAAGAGDCGGAAGISLLSLHERGFVRHRAGTSLDAARVELTASGARLLAEAGVALQHLETRMHAHLASRGLLAIHKVLDDIGAAATAREVALT